MTGRTMPATDAFSSGFGRPAPRRGSPSAVTDSSGLVHSSGIVIGSESRHVTAAIASISDSCETHWGLRPEQLIGRTVRDFISWAPLPRIRPEEERLGPFLGTDFNGRDWFVTLTYRFRQPMVHLEPVPDLPGRGIDTALWLATSTERLDYLHDPMELWQEGADNIRSILDFDRTLVVQFNADRHGEIITESLPGEGRSLLGLRFPPAASSAERLITTPVRSFSVDESMPCLVVPRSDPRGQPWDLTLSPLRHVGAGHRAVTKTLGAKSSLVLNLAGVDGVAYAIGSHSAEPRRLDALTRSAVEVYARTLHERAEALVRARDAARRTEKLALQQRIVERLDTRDIATSLADAPADSHDMLELVTADAAILQVGGQRRVVGTLEAGEVAAIDHTVRVWLATLSRHGALMTDGVRSMHPKLSASAPDVAGLLAASVGAQGDYLCWVRRPSPTTVTWFDSDPDKGTFATRVEEITDRSEPWTQRDQLAAESLAREIEETLLRRAQADLAQLALVDALTGLPNRRLLLDRLDKAIGRAARGHHFALLFLDLNDFKAVNDTLGHQAGDEVLIETARRLEEAVRDGDTVARLAGDEFVVLCEDTRQGEEVVVADRIRAGFAEPFIVSGREVNVGVAIGVGHLELGVDAPSLLDRADRAMYEAKSEMKRR